METLQRQMADFDVREFTVEKSNRVKEAGFGPSSEIILICVLPFLGRKRL